MKWLNVVMSFPVSKQMEYNGIANLYDKQLFESLQKFTFVYLLRQSNCKFSHIFNVINAQSDLYYLENVHIRSVLNCNYRTKHHSDNAKLNSQHPI